jgi:SAM-dependent methyltransferase
MLAPGDSHMAQIEYKLREAVSRAKGFFGEHVVDRSRGTDTSRIVDLATAGVHTDGRIPYVPSGWRSLPSALRHIPISDGDVFLDLGSGKGRVVLQAAERPFKRVIGVELSPELNAVAQENLHAVRAKLRCQDVELIEADITTYPIPDDVTIVYAYNPVRGELFEAAMTALIASYDRNPRPMHLLYRYPREHDALDASGRFQLLQTVTSWRPRRSWSNATAINIYAATPAHELQT